MFKRKVLELLEDLSEDDISPASGFTFSVTPTPPPPTATSSFPTTQLPHTFTHNAPTPVLSFEDRHFIPGDQWNMYESILSQHATTESTLNIK